MEDRVGKASPGQGDVSRIPFGDQAGSPYLTLGRSEAAAKKKLGGGRVRRKGGAAS